MMRPTHCMPGTHSRFNHVAMSVAASLLEASERRDLLAFYGDVFGWTEMPAIGREGELLVMRVHRNDQFVFLHAQEQPMQCPPEDHVGLSVDSPEALETLVQRAREAAKRHPSVEIRPEEPQDFGVLTLHACYIRYRLPLTFEVQCFAWAPGFDAHTLPDA